MLSILLLASVVNANAVLSLPENFMATAQDLSSQLRTTTLNYARRHARRLQDKTTACAWDNGKCTLSPDFVTSSGAKDEHSPIKHLAAQSIACSEVQEQAACIGDCAYKSGKCDISEKASEKLLKDIFLDGSKDCGALSAMMQADECGSKAEADCTDKCEWHKSGDYELDATGNTCEEVPECKKKTDPSDPFGMNAICPNMEAVKTECEAKEGTKAQTDCFGEKCPIMLMFIGGMACGTSPTEDKCMSNGEICVWKDTKKCEMDMDFLLDLLAPKGCWLRPMIQESMECGQEKTADTCTGKCEWQKKSECKRAGDPETKEECSSNGQSMLTALLGDHAVRQQDACQKATSISTCTSVETIPDDTQTTALATGAATSVETTPDNAQTTAVATGADDTQVSSLARGESMAVCATLTVFAGILLA